MKLPKKSLIACLLLASGITSGHAQTADNIITDNHNTIGLLLLLIVLVVPLILLIAILYSNFKNQLTENDERKNLAGG